MLLLFFQPVASEAAQQSSAPHVVGRSTLEALLLDDDETAALSFALPRRRRFTIT